MFSGSYKADVVPAAVGPEVALLVVASEVLK
jgi:hypothetical protein